MAAEGGPDPTNAWMRLPSLPTLGTGLSTGSTSWLTSGLTDIMDMDAPAPGLQRRRSARLQKEELPEPPPLSFLLSRTATVKQPPRGDAGHPAQATASVTAAGTLQRVRSSKRVASTGAHSTSGGASQQHAKRARPAACSLDTALGPWHPHRVVQTHEAEGGFGANVVPRESAGWFSHSPSAEDSVLFLKRATGVSLQLTSAKPIAAGTYATILCRPRSMQDACVKLEACAKHSGAGSGNGKGKGSSKGSTRVVTSDTRGCIYGSNAAGQATMSFELQNGIGQDGWTLLDPPIEVKMACLSSCLQLPSKELACLEIRLLTSRHQHLGTMILPLKVVTRPKRDATALLKKSMPKAAPNNRAPQGKPAADRQTTQNPAVAPRPGAPQVACHATTHTLEVTDPHVYAVLRDMKQALEMCQGPQHPAPDGAAAPQALQRAQSSTRKRSGSNGSPCFSKEWTLPLHEAASTTGTRQAKVRVDIRK